MKAILSGGVVAALILIAEHYLLRPHLKNDQQRYTGGTVALNIGTTTSAILLRCPEAAVLPWCTSVFGGGITFSMRWLDSGSPRRLRWSGGAARQVGLGHIHSGIGAHTERGSDASVYASNDVATKHSDRELEDLEHDLAAISEIDECARILSDRIVQSDRNAQIGDTAITDLDARVQIGDTAINDSDPPVKNTGDISHPKGRKQHRSEVGVGVPTSKKKRESPTTSGRRAETQNIASQHAHTRVQTPLETWLIAQDMMPASARRFGQLDEATAADFVSRNWLNQSTAALLAKQSTPREVVDQVLRAPEPPKVKDVQRAIREAPQGQHSGRSDRASPRLTRQPTPITSPPRNRTFPKSPPRR